jgi:hypothetical protein
MARGVGWPCADVFTLTRLPVTTNITNDGETEHSGQEGACGLADFLY